MRVANLAKLDLFGQPIRPACRWHRVGFTLLDLYLWSAGDPKLTPPQQTGSWAYAILPYR